MRKALLPTLASLTLCGAATTALILSAHAQPAPKGPTLVAPHSLLAANDGPGGRPLHMSDTDRAQDLKQMCRDRFAHQAGGLAYLAVQLDLTAAQQPLFDHWRSTRLDIAKRRADACVQRPARQARDRMPNPAEMMARQEDRLKQHLADLDAERPALQALYAGLSPQQKAEFGRDVMLAMRDRGEMGRGMMRHRMFADAMGPRGMRPGMGGPMGRESMRPDGMRPDDMHPGPMEMGDHPTPPPEQ